MDATKIDPPTGQPFRVVGTEEARSAVQWVCDDLDTACMNHGLGKLEDNACARVTLSNVLSHRDHLFAQVTELQADNTRLTERARVAEAENVRMRGPTIAWEEAFPEEAEAARKTSIAEGDTLHLAVFLDELDSDDFLRLDDDTRAAAARVLKAAGQAPRSPETRALTGEAKPVPFHGLGHVDAYGGGYVGVLHGLGSVTKIWCDEAGAARALDAYLVEEKLVPATWSKS